MSKDIDYINQPKDVRKKRCSHDLERFSHCFLCDTLLCQFHELHEDARPCLTLATMPLKVDDAPYLFCEEHFESVAKAAQVA